MKVVVVVGAGGHGRVLIAALRRCGIEPRACLDASPHKWGQSLHGVPIVGGDDRLGSVASLDDVQLVNGIGYVDQPGPRRAVWERFAGKCEFIGVRDVSAFVEDDVELGTGAQVLARAVVQTGARIGENTILNTGVQVDHDCRIGAHSHVAPGAVLCGDVTIGNAVLVGAGAVIKQGIAVGDGARIGLGAVVVRDVPVGAVVVGVPARQMDAR